MGQDREVRLVRRPDDDDQNKAEREPEGGRAAERLREFMIQRFGEHNVGHPSESEKGDETLDTPSDDPPPARGDNTE
jgi:hypothetical protein